MDVSAIGCIDDVNFFDLQVNHELVRTSMEVAYSSPCGNQRLYFKKNLFCEGFHAIALCFASVDSEVDNKLETKYSHWESKSLKVDILFSANAMFDGIRHLNFNEYINYPNIEALGAMLEELRTMEVQRCSQAD